MRITNSMMINNALGNINTNKLLLDQLETQMATQKKISRPSDDPIVAIRALRLRSNLSEVTQYYERNVPDARSWLETTEDTLTSIRDAINSMYQEIVGISNNYEEAEDRSAVIQNLEALRDQIYSELLNADYAGRGLLTGYKTQTSATFTEADDDISYRITETFTANDIELMTYISDKVDADIDINNVSGISASETPQENSVYRIRLAYDDLEALALATNSSLTQITVDGTIYDVSIRTLADGDSAYLEFDEDPATGFGANFIEDTGELILNEAFAHELQSANNISFTYEKKGFVKGELRPEHYFDCVNTTDPNNEISYTKTTQDIEYKINFNQTLKVNTEASDFIDHDLYRDIDELIELLNAAFDTNDKVDKIKSMIEQEETTTNDEDTLSNLNSILEAVEKEKTLVDDKLTKMFHNYNTKFQEYFDQANLAVTNVGNRIARLDLAETRLQAQQTNYQTLKDNNENLELSTILIQFTAAELAYNAALTAGGKVVQQSLLDFI